VAASMSREHADQHVANDDEACSYPWSLGRFAVGCSGSGVPLP